MDSDNTYEVTVIVTDSDSSSQSFDLELTIIDDDEPAIFDYGDGNTSVTFKNAGQFAEESNYTNIFQVKARDIDTDIGYMSDIIYVFTPYIPELI